MKSRNDKIRFLKGLATGIRSTKELTPRKSIFLIKEEGSEEYREGVNGKVWNEAEIQEHQKRHPQDHLVIILVKRDSTPNI